MYVQARLASDVRPLTDAIKQMLESRHRAGARYDVENLVGHSGRRAADRVRADHRADPGFRPSR